METSFRMKSSNPRMFFGFPRRCPQFLLPSGERDYGDRVLWEETVDFRQIGFAAGFILRCVPATLNAALFQQRQRLRAISVRKNELDPCGLSMPR